MIWLKKGLIELLVRYIFFQDFKAGMLGKENYYNGLNIEECHAPRVSIRHFMERLEHLRSVEVAFPPRAGGGGGGVVGWLGRLIPGGVVVLLHASQELEKLHDAATCPERKFTIQLFQNALKMPV